MRANRRGDLTHSYGRQKTRGNATDGQRCPRTPRPTTSSGADAANPNNNTDVAALVGRPLDAPASIKRRKHTVCPRLTRTPSHRQGPPGDSPTTPSSTLGRYDHCHRSSALAPDDATGKRNAAGMGPLTPRRARRTSAADYATPHHHQRRTRHRRRHLLATRQKAAAKHARQRRPIPATRRVPGFSISPSNAHRKKTPRPTRRSPSTTSGAFRNPRQPPPPSPRRAAAPLCASPAGVLALHRRDATRTTFDSPPDAHSLRQPHRHRGGRRWPRWTRTSAVRVGTKTGIPDRRRGTC